MPQMVRDDSIGAALGALAGGMFPNPKSQAEAMFMREKILSSQAERAQNELKTQELRGQMGAQNNLISEFRRMMTPQMLGISPTIDALDSDPATSGGVVAVPNPIMDGLDQRIRFANAAAENAFRRGGGPKEAGEAAFQQLGFGAQLAGGPAQSEAHARHRQFFVTGKVPDANTPLTDAGRRALVDEQIAKQAATQTITPHESQFTIVPRAIAEANGIPLDPATNQYRVAPTQTGPYTGNSMEAQNMRTIYNYTEKKRMGMPITPQEETAYALAYGQVYGPKEDVRAGPNGGLVGVTLQPFVPNVVTPPGGVGGPRIAPAAAPAPAPAVTGTGPAAASVAATNAAAAAPAPAPAPTGAPTQPNANGVRTLLPGNKNPTEAQASAESYFDRASLAHPMLNEFTPETLPTAWGRFVTDPRGLVPEDVGNLLASPEAKKWRANAEGFISAALRRESGAAIGDSEFKSYAKFLIPAPNDDTQTLALKRMYRESMLRGLQTGTITPDPERTTPDQLKGMIENQLRQEGLLGNGTPARGAAATGPAPNKNYSDVDAIVGIGGGRK